MSSSATATAPSREARVLWHSSHLLYLKEFSGIRSVQRQRHVGSQTLVTISVSPSFFFKILCGGCQWLWFMFLILIPGFFRLACFLRVKIWLSCCDDTSSWECPQRILAIIRAEVVDSSSGLSAFIVTIFFTSQHHPIPGDFGVWLIKILPVPALHPDLLDRRQLQGLQRLLHYQQSQWSL